MLYIKLCLLIWSLSFLFLVFRLFSIEDTPTFIEISDRIKDEEYEVGYWFLHIILFILLFITSPYYAAKKIIDSIKKQPK